MRIRHIHTRRIYFMSKETWDNMPKREKAVFDVIDESEQEVIAHPAPIKRVTIKLPDEIKDNARKGTTEASPEPLTNKG